MFISRYWLQTRVLVGEQTPPQIRTLFPWHVWYDVGLLWYCFICISFFFLKKIHHFNLQWRRSLIFSLRKTPFMDMGPAQWTGKFWDMIFFGYSGCSHKRRLVVSVRSSHRHHISFSFHVWITVTSQDSSCSLLIPHVFTVFFFFLESRSFMHIRSFLFDSTVDKDSFCNMCVRLCVTIKDRFLWDHFQISLQVPIPTMLQKFPCRKREFSSREPLTTRRQGKWYSHPVSQFGRLRQHCSKNCFQSVHIQDVIIFDQQLWALLCGNRCTSDQLWCHHPVRERCILSFASFAWRRRTQSKFSKDSSSFLPFM